MRHCECGKEISRRCRSGRCKRCARLAHVASWTPEQRQAASDHGKRYVVHVLAPDIMAKSHAPEARRQATERRRWTMLGWCPDEHLDTYRLLSQRKRLPREEARAVIELEIPGTVEHARRTIANNIDIARIREERRKREAY